jgi:hypothetical protein
LPIIVFLRQMDLGVGAFCCCARFIKRGFQSLAFCSASASAAFF